MLASDDLLNIPNNVLLENLEVEKWNLGLEDGVSISKSPNLDDILTYAEGGKTFQARDIFRRSFFWYMGSATTPPCVEEINRFVFSQVIFVPSFQLQELKDKTFLNELEVTGNVKKAHSPNNRMTYYHVDNGKKCTDVNFELASLEPGEAEKIMEKKKKKGHQFLDLTSIKPNYIKASSKTVTYGVNSFPYHSTLATITFHLSTKSSLKKNSKNLEEDKDYSSMRFQRMMCLMTLE